jgi:replicative DNA helicase
MKKQHAIPHDAQAEQCVLGGLMCYGDLIDEWNELTGEHFFTPANATILDTIKSIRAEAGQPDLISVTQHLSSLGKLENVGGAGALAEIYSMAGPRDLSYYVNILREHVARRRMVEAGVRMAAAGRDIAQNVSEVVAEAGESILSINLDGPSQGSVHVSETIDDAIRDIEEAIKHRGKPRGLRTGFEQFDILTGGLQPGQLVLVAGRPSMGKSALLINMCDRMVATGTPCLLFSLEMPKRSITTRIAQARARANSARVRLGTISTDDQKRLGRELHLLGTQPLHIDEARGATIMDIRGRARRDMRRHGIKAVFVDYAQLLEAKGYNTSYERVSAVSRGLKAMALELGVPVIAAAQIGRKGEDRNENRPRMSDLKDSGSLEQDADIITIIHRPDYYETGPGADSRDHQEAEWNVAKHREGQTRTFKMVWSPSFTRFDHALDSRTTDEPATYSARQRDLPSTRLGLAQEAESFNDITPQMAAQPDLHEINTLLNE